MYRFMVSRRLLAASRKHFSGLSSSSLITTTTTTTTTCHAPAAAWHASQRASVSTTPPMNDAEDEEAPWNSVEGIYTEAGDEWDGCRRDFMAPIEIGTRGADILHNPFFNKGTAFKSEERDRLRFRGLLPPRFNNISMQMARFLKALRSTESDIQKNIKLEDLHDTNETLYHRILVDHIEGMLDKYTTIELE